MFRRLAEPEDTSKFPMAVFNTIIEYNSTLARKELGGMYSVIIHSE